MEEKQLVEHVDSKADKIKDFKIISQLLWKKACGLMAGKVGNVVVLDSCMGGGSLLSCLPKDWSAVGYERDYSKFTYAKGLLDSTMGLDVNLTNEPFEFHFTKPTFPEFDLAITIPDTDAVINAEYEKEEEYLKMKNYVYYCITKCLEVLKDDGYMITAVPNSILENDSYKQEKIFLMKKAKVVKSEKFNTFAILILQKK